MGEEHNGTLKHLMVMEEEAKKIINIITPKGLMDLGTLFNICTKQDLDFDGSNPQVSTPNSSFNGFQGRNICVAEDRSGNLLFSSNTSRKRNGVANVCVVLDRNNDLMYGATGIKSDYRGKSLATAMPGTIGGYYLFTVSTGGVPYYHVIDLTHNNGLGEVTGTINQSMDAAGGYGYGMALYEDHTGLAPTKLFLRRSAGDSTQIVSFAITGNGVGESVVEATFAVKDVYGTGEMQLSPDGGMLAIATKDGGVSLVSGVGELRIFHLNPNHTIDSLQNFLIFGNTKHVASFDFSPLGKYVYYTKTHSTFSTVNNKTLERYHLATGQDNHSIELYKAEATQQKLDYIHNNPVEEGFVSNQEDYLYSSARNYAALDNVLEIDFI